MTSLVHFPWKKNLRRGLIAGTVFLMPLAAMAQGSSQYTGTSANTRSGEATALPSNASATITPALPKMADTSTATTTTTTSSHSSSGIVIPAPPPPTTPPLNSNAADLAAQAEQAALQAQADADAAQMQREVDHNRKSFERAENGILPLSGDQIRTFMHKLENTQQAAQPPASGQPKGEVRIKTLSLDPGTEPPQVNLAAGYVTTINMLDASGEPWPIMDVGVGGNFEVSPTPSGTHVIRVMPLTRFGSGNLSVQLKDLPTPVIFRVNAGGPNVDLRFDARVPKYGPNAKMPLVDHPRLEAGNEQIMMMLDNAPPNDAKSMKISGLDARTKAWMMGDHVYVRTPLTLLSPSWNASVTSADGMTVYEIGDAPVLLMSDNGAMVRARLLRDEDHDK